MVLYLYFSVVIRCIFHADGLDYEWKFCFCSLSAARQYQDRKKCHTSLFLAYCEIFGDTLSICRGKSRLAWIFNRCEVGVGVRGPTEGRWWTRRQWTLTASVHQPATVTPILSRCAPSQISNTPFQISNTPNVFISNCKINTFQIAKYICPKLYFFFFKFSNIF